MEVRSFQFALLFNFWTMLAPIKHNNDGRSLSPCSETFTSSWVTLDKYIFKVKHNFFQHVFPPVKGQGKPVLTFLEIFMFSTWVKREGCWSPFSSCKVKAYNSMQLWFLVKALNDCQYKCNCLVKTLSTKKSCRRRKFFAGNLISTYLFSEL